VRGQLNSCCPEGTAGRLPLERRRATLTAARQALRELRFTGWKRAHLFPLTPAPRVGKQVCSALPAPLRKKPAPHAPRSDATLARKEHLCGRPATL
jgi:hypothetical protein